MFTPPDGERITNTETNKRGTTKEKFLPYFWNQSPKHIVHLIKEKKTRTSGKLFSPACLPPMPVLFNDMIDSGRESVGRYQAKKIQCQDTVPDE